MQQSNGSIEKQTKILIELLEEFDLEDILEFGVFYQKKQKEAYSDLMWEACAFITCVGGEQNFLNFLAWLIAQGQDVYTKALENPDSLHEILDSENRGDARDEFFSSVVMKAHHAKVGNNNVRFPRHLVPVVTKKRAKELSSGQSVRQALPNLHEKLGQCPEI
ncbi:MAG: DUF4240 domain-containing protein [Chloroflexota bacterium]